MVEVHFFGHSFFKIGFKNANVLIDPFIYNTNSDPAFKRLVDCPVKLNDLKDIALILVSHEHFDHFDKKAIEFIAKRDNALVGATQNILNELNLPRNLMVPLEGNQVKQLRGIQVEVIPTHHHHSFYPLGFVLSQNGKSILHPGDTTLISEFDKIKPDLALLPIGGTFTMDLVDAVRATKTMKPKYVIPMHYNTFSMIKADTREFVQKIKKSILKTKPVVLSPGQKFNF